jgi:aldose 1-epimerase
MIKLANKFLSIGILPELGAGLAFMKAQTALGEVDLMREAPESITHPNQLACFVLMPWSNRIGEGGITVEGTFYPIENNMEDDLPLHGDAWFLEWELTEHSDTHASFVLDSTSIAPFDYSATIDYRLVENQLEVRLALTHMGDHSAPYGIGLHPFFTRTPLTTLQANMQEVYFDSASTLPTHFESVEKHPHWDFTQGSLLPEVFTDHQFQKWDSLATITWPELACKLHLSNSAKWSYAVLYAPKNTPFFCFEPVSHVVNAHHHKSPKEDGLVWLKNGQTLATKCIFKVQAE